MFGEASPASGNARPNFACPHCTLNPLGEFYLWPIRESKPPNKPGLAFLFVVLYCSFACFLTVDIENKSTLLGFHLGSPSAFELVDCLGTDATKYGLQMLEEYLSTPSEKKKSCEIK